MTPDREEFVADAPHTRGREPTMAMAGVGGEGVGGVVDLSTLSRFFSDLSLKEATKQGLREHLQLEGFVQAEMTVLRAPPGGQSPHPHPQHS